MRSPKPPSLHSRLVRQPSRPASGIKLAPLSRSSSGEILSAGSSSEAKVAVPAPQVQHRAASHTSPTPSVASADSGTGAARSPDTGPSKQDPSQPFVRLQSSEATQSVIMLLRKRINSSRSDRPGSAASTASSSIHSSNQAGSRPASRGAFGPSRRVSSDIKYDDWVNLQETAVQRAERIRKFGMDFPPGGPKPRAAPRTVTAATTSKTAIVAQPPTPPASHSPSVGQRRSEEVNTSGALLPTKQ